jgi:glycosyltransferase involved in cell wall biosynthesis
MDVKVVHCGVEMAESPALLRTVDPTVRLLSVGRLIEKKGFTYCIEAARILTDLGYRIQWSIVGEGPLSEQLAKQIKSMALATHVVLRGYMANAQVVELLKHACDAFVLPCVVAADGDEDGIPVAIMEAMSFGIPVITTRVGGIAELIADGETGFLARTRDSTDLAEVLSRIITDPTRAQIVGRQGASRVRQMFSAEREAEKMHCFFTELLPSSSSVDSC